MAIFGRNKRGEYEDDAYEFEKDLTPDAPVSEITGKRTVEQYLHHLLTMTQSLRPFGVGLLDVTDLTLCESLNSDLDLPLYTAALCDGWAVRASNLVGASQNHPIALPVVDVAVAGRIPDPLSSGTTVKVFYGGPVPEGADAVVPATDVTQIAGSEKLPEGIRFTAEAAFNQFLYPRGNRIAENQPLLPEGTVLNPRMVAMLAEVGHDKVLARPRPRVVVATIGSGLVEPGMPLTQLNQLYDSTTALIAACARNDLAQVFPIGILRDDVAILKSVLAEQLIRADLLLVVAAANENLISALSQLGSIDLANIAMWPNGPRLFATIGSGQTPVLVLPEGAIQSYISYQVFARPLLRQLAGVDPMPPKLMVDAICRRTFGSDQENTQFVLALYADGQVEALDLPPDAGGLELAKANAMVVVEPGQQIEAGSQLACWLLDG